MNREWNHGLSDLVVRVGCVEIVAKSLTNDQEIKSNDNRTYYVRINSIKSKND